MNETLNKYFLKLKNPKILIFAGFLGIALIFLSSFATKEKTKKAETEVSPVTAEQYCENLREDIMKTVREITGDKRATVVVTLESGIRYSYAEEKAETAHEKSEQNSDTSETEFKAGYITVKTADGGEQALLLTAEMPEIRGVAIVCEGGDNEIIREKIQNTVTAALNITSKRVYICGRKS